MAQTPEGVTGFASRNVLLAPDEAIVELTATVPRNRNLEAVLEALGPVGVRREHLVSVTLRPGQIGSQPVTPGQPVPPIGLLPAFSYSYGFLLRLAPAAVPDLVTKLGELERSGRLGQGSLSASGWLTASEAALAKGRLEVLPGLLADARRRAEMWRQTAGLASAAGIVFLSDFMAQTGRTSVLLGSPPVLDQSGATATYSLGLRMGQGSRTLGVTAARIVVLSPERVTFRVSMFTAPEVTTEQVLEHLGGAGFVAGDIESVQASGSGLTPPPGTAVRPAPSGLTYQLASTQPAEYADSILDVLDRLQQSPPRGVRNLSFSGAMNVSTETIAALRENLLPILMEQARQKAASLAQIAGWRVRDVLTVGEGSGGGVSGGFPLLTFGPVPAFSNLRIASSLNVQFSAE